MTTVHRPPRIFSPLPWLGHAMSLNRAPLDFMRRCQQRHGDIFSLALPGGRRTFVLDPHDHVTYFKDKRLVFREVGTELGAKIFGYEPAKTGVDIGAMTHHTGRQLMGAQLEPLTTAMQRELAGRLDHHAAPRRTGLLEWLNEHLFGSGVDALFGQGFATPELLQDYEQFDAMVPARAAGVPTWALPKFRAVRQRLADATSRQCPLRSAVFEERAAEYDAADTPQCQRQSMELAWLWASQVNTVVSAFWAVLYIAADADASEAVGTEARALLQDRDLDRAPLDKAELKSMAALDSAIKEALRLTSSSIITRRATETMDFPSQSGKVYRFEAGESVNLFTGLTHLDPEIFEDPSVFRYDRFIGEGRGPSFFKGGKRVQFPTLPFGSGASMCPGRFFAINELKLTVAQLFAKFEIDLGEVKAPPQDASRLGLGILPPKHDVMMSIRPRTS